MTLTEYKKQQQCLNKREVRALKQWHFHKGSLIRNPSTLGTPLFSSCLTLKLKHQYMLNCSKKQHLSLWLSFLITKIISTLDLVESIMWVSHAWHNKGRNKRLINLSNGTIESQSTQLGKIIINYNWIVGSWYQ